jgi:hypothetical protein
MIAGTTQGAIKQRAHRAYLTLRERLARPGAAAEREPRREPGQRKASS